MRILFLSAFYPPYSIGGWEQLARDINNRLQARGHITHVLTSTHGTDASSNTHSPDEHSVERILKLESHLHHYRLSDFTSYSKRLQYNRAVTRESIERFRPDVVFVHVMFNLSPAVPRVAEELLPGRVVYYIANDWPYAPDPHTAYWHSPATRPWSRLIKRLVSPFALHWLARKSEQLDVNLDNVLSVSQAVRRDLIRHASVAPEAIKVVYNGVEVDKFKPDGQSARGSEPITSNGAASQRTKPASLALLYAGSIVEHKGIHTAVEALAHLKKQSKLSDINLTIVGSGHPDYETRLKRMVQQEGLGNHVRFQGRVARKEMPKVMAQADALLVPSLWEEPLSRVMQEGMAAGLVVIGTLTGGTGELLVEGETGLTFEPGNAEMLAQRFCDLISSPDLREKLRRNGREAVVSRFDIRRMVDEIEEHLVETVERAALI